MSGVKKSGRAKLREEGLERTDNNLQSNTWPVIQMINQKNYYTEYLKRDEQIMVIRQQQDEAKAAAAATKTAAPQPDPDSMDVDEPEKGEGEEEIEEPLGMKVIVIHPGSQNLRIGLASDALPKTIPMVIARKSDKAEWEVNTPTPVRVADDEPDADAFFGEEFDKHYNAMAVELRSNMRATKRRILPNSRELVISYNRRSQPERINEHNDPNRVEWTEIPDTNPPEYFVGNDALRIADNSTPRYKLLWPLRHGWFNEKDYKDKRRMLEDLAQILESAIVNELGVKRADFKNYSTVLVIPDLYEKTYVTAMMEMLFRDFMFAQVCVFQESLSATFGAGFSSACIVDIGAQKTSICCVEEGMCIAESRMNIKYGGSDITNIFLKMILSNSFPYQEINLWRRYDLLLAEDLKKTFCSLDESKVAVTLHPFFVRAPGSDTKKFQFKTYDEVMLAPLSLFSPNILEEDQPGKLEGRRSLFERSTDIYDGSPNDPTSGAQLSIYPPPPQINNAPSIPSDLRISSTSATTNGASAPAPTSDPTSTPSRPLLMQHQLEQNTPRSSVAGSPVPEAPPAPGTATPIPPTGPSPTELAIHRDSHLPIPPLDKAVYTSITHAAKGDPKKIKDFLSSIMLVGGGGLVGGHGSFNIFLEERLRSYVANVAANSAGMGEEDGGLGGIGADAAGAIVVGVPPRELDPQVVVWKGASVFGRLKGNDCWIGRREYDILGVRLLTYKCLWTY